VLGKLSRTALRVMGHNMIKIYAYYLFDYFLGSIAIEIFPSAL